jgi:probable rRNA maturation factor
MHLSHDWPTDVISFNLSAAGEAELAGELIVSTEMALACATELMAEPADELVLYVVHGLLHLCGYDDSTDLDREQMRVREAAQLKRLQAFSTSFPPGALCSDGRRQEQTTCPG